MINSVNLENLREMTGGDPDLEKELFSVYIESSDQALVTLRNSLANGDQETWRTTAHAWKGTNLNLGAEELARLCSLAQTSFAAPVEEKTQILAAITEAYDNVKRYLDTLV